MKINHVVDPVTGCWLWQGGKDRIGYGRAEKDECVNGHDMSDAYVTKAGSRIRRTCRKCQAERSRKWHQKKTQQPTSDSPSRG